MNIVNYFINKVLFFEKLKIETLLNYQGRNHLELHNKILYRRGLCPVWDDMIYSQNSVKTVISVICRVILFLSQLMYQNLTMTVFFLKGIPKSRGFTPQGRKGDYKSQ